MMKRLNMIILTLSCLVAAIGCNRTEEEYLTVSQSSIELTSDANDIKFTVSSNVKWTMTISDVWFKITPKVGNGETEIRLVAERNATGMDRSSVLEFSAGTIVERVQVTQPAYAVNMSVDCPESVMVKKGEALTINLTSPVDDWEYTLTNGSWLKEFSKTNSKLIFQLDPSVKFDEKVAAEIEFTSPSNPTYYEKATVLPVNYFSFKADVPESLDLGERGSQLKISVESNIDWTYSLKNAAWLVEYDKTGKNLVFDGNVANLLDQNTKAEITFSSPDYANFSYTAQVQPIAPITSRMVDKSGLNPIFLDGDTKWTSGTEQYLFNGAWPIYKGRYAEYIDGDPNKANGISYKGFTISVNDYTIKNNPLTFTIDAGKRINLSKFVVYDYYQYERNSPLTFDVYAYKPNETPTGKEPLGTEDGWVKIGSVNNVGKITEYNAKYNSGDYFPELAQGDIINISEEDTFPARYYRFAMTGNGYWWYGALRNETGISINYDNGNCWARFGWCMISEISLYEYIDY